MYISAWAATSLYSDFRVQIWFNPVLPGSPSLSDRVSTTNFTLKPQPQPKVQLLYASNVNSRPEEGMEAFSFRGGPQNTMYVQENGKFIFPPGGSFALVLAHPEDPDAQAEGALPSVGMRNRYGIVDGAATILGAFRISMNAFEGRRPSSTSEMQQKSARH